MTFNILSLSQRDLSNIDGSAYAGFLDPRQVEKFTENDILLYPDNTMPGKLELYDIISLLYIID